ncbi:MAG: M14 family metallopeptidase [Cyclobacteriaceae bacterium]|nr:M14 family metallopeptidase [Cyclobacteriaceae bacterium]
MTLAPKAAQNPDFVHQLVQDYPKFKENRLQHRRFKHQFLQELLLPLSQNGFEINKAGESFKGRDIQVLTIGAGDIKILMWSQMHGDEATATMALLDLSNYLSQNDNADIQELLQRVTLYFVPMLNPDGAEQFQRRTAQGIDMNRDALALQCPESRILKEFRDRINPHFGFNLHDQNDYYTVGLTEKPATISFLAPAYNQAKSINETRLKAMQVIATMNHALQQLIPDQVARYDDRFEPRAFGDNIQKWGTSTILIESGPYPNDPEKQQVRLMNYVALITAIYSIAESSYQVRTHEEYEAIPENYENLNDVMIRGIKVVEGNKAYSLDIAIRKQEFDQNGSFPVYYGGRIEDAGDLSTKYGYREIVAKDLIYAPAKIYPEVLTDLDAARKLPLADLLAQGYTAIRLQVMPTSKACFTLDILGSETTPRWGRRPELIASFLMMRDSTIAYAVINGFVHKIGEPVEKSAHGWVFR